MSDVGSAFSVLAYKVRTDPSYREGWQANIAMAFYDTWRWELNKTVMGRLLYKLAPSGLVHRISNRAAAYFIRVTFGAPEETK